MAIEDLGRPWRRAMVPRDPDQHPRAATPLELLFDLCFVVAVSYAARGLHDGLVTGALFEPIIGFLMVFFAIWWAWMNFTWFASAYDTDDVPYRLLTLLMITGVLILAAGVPSAFESGNFKIATAGYVTMRIALVAQWLRAASGDPDGRAVARRYAFGVAAVQLLWIAHLGVHTDHDRVLFLGLVVAELAVPMWAETAGRATPWHPDHIAERFGLFTIIVLGECILSATVAMQSALTSGGVSSSLLVVAGSALVIVFAVWWSYFQESAEEHLRGSIRVAFVWGYSHYFVFASIAALGAGLEVVAGSQEHLPEGEEHAFSITVARIALTVAVPLVTYLATLVLYRARVAGEGMRRQSHLVVAAVAIVIAAVLAGTLGVPGSMVAMAAVMAAIVAIDVHHDHGVSRGPEPAVL